MENTLKFCQANTKQIDQTSGIIPFTMTTFTVDESGDVMNPLGALLDEFVKNPISLWMHQLFQVPPSKMIPETITQTSLVMEGSVQFDLSDPFGEFLFGKYVNGFLAAGSIRFVPIEFSREVVLEGQTGFFFRIWKLKEFSLVTLPDNVEALRKDYKDGEQGLYENFQEPYYSAIKRFYEYHNRNLDIGKQIFSFCTGEGCKDVSHETVEDDMEQQTDCELNKKGNIIKDEQNFLKEMAQSLKSIEDILKLLKMPKSENKETTKDTVSKRQFLEMLEVLSNSKEAKIG